MSLQASHLLDLSPKFFCADIKKFLLCPQREFLGWACACAPSLDLPPPWKRQDINWGPIRISGTAN